VRVLGGQTIRRDRRVDEKASDRLHDANHLAECCGEGVDLFENVSAPYEVEVRVRVGDLVHAAFVQRDSIGHARGVDRSPRTVNMNRDRFDADTVNVEAADQFDEMSTIAASRIEHDVARTKEPSGLVEERLRPCGIKADVKTLVHIPGGRAVHASEALEVA